MVHLLCRGKVTGGSAGTARTVRVAPKRPNVKDKVALLPQLLYRRGPFRQPSRPGTTYARAAAAAAASPVEVVPVSLDSPLTF